MSAMFGMSMRVLPKCLHRYSKSSLICFSGIFFPSASLINLTFLSSFLPSGLWFSAGAHPLSSEENLVLGILGFLQILRVLIANRYRIRF